MEAAPPPPPPSLVVIDDDENDLFFLKRLLAKAGVSNPTTAFTNGDEAIGYLRQLAAAPAGPLPLLAILDVRMPGRDGFEVLSAIRSEPRLAPLAVAMVSSSSAQRDVTRARTLGAQAYLVKYPFPQVFRDLVDAAAEYARSPDRSAPLRLTASLFGTGPAAGKNHGLA